MTPAEYRELFKDFVGRDEALAEVTRYDPYEIMYYRSNDLVHSWRVMWIVKELNDNVTNVFGHYYDPGKAQLLALVHDDAEIVMGDFSSGEKAHLNAVQAAERRMIEIEAIEEVAGRFPRMLGSRVYRDLLFDMLDHGSLEARVVDYADKFDALGEALHEVYAGNMTFTTPPPSLYGRSIDIPTVHYKKYFDNFSVKYPTMQPLFSVNSPLLQPIEAIDDQMVAASARPHTVDSITAPAGHIAYDAWRQAIIKHAPDHHQALLYTQVESSR